mmetsp:Transcript_12916/g.36864  ORF Transcript_12916/g.36864 Transcript_12916/m.36864 type:complete len:200 (+) Transcript_12916:455-1054(+)
MIYWRRCARRDSLQIPCSPKRSAAASRARRRAGRRRKRKRLPAGALPDQMLTSSGTTTKVRRFLIKKALPMTSCKLPTPIQLRSIMMSIITYRAKNVSKLEGRVIRSTTFCWGPARMEAVAALKVVAMKLSSLACRARGHWQQSRYAAMLVQAVLWITLNPPSPDCFPGLPVLNMSRIEPRVPVVRAEEIVVCEKCSVA